MKIGIFLPNATFDLPGSSEVGGIESFAFTIGEVLQRMGHEVILFGGEPKPGCIHRKTSLTLELHPYWETQSIPNLGTRFQRLIQRLHFAWSCRKAWKRHRCELVLISKPFDWPVAWWWKLSRRDLKVIMGFQGTDFFFGDRLFYGAVDAAYAVGEQVGDLAEARVGKRPALIPNPVDTSFFTPDGEKPSDKDWHIVASGRLVGWKGHMKLVEAVAELIQKHNLDVRLSLAGSGPEWGYLLAKIAELGLQSRIKLNGLLNAASLRDFLRTGDLYVQPSIGMEAFSISALEAACVGLPLLLSDTVGLIDFITEIDAETYPAKKSAELVAWLRKLYERRNDPAWTNRAARHARIHAQFSAQGVAAQILHLVGK